MDAADVTRTVSLAEAVTRVSTIVAADESRSEETRVKLLGQLALFARSMRSHGVEFLDDVDEALAMVFVEDMVKSRGGVPDFPSASIQKTRRWAVRTFFLHARSLGLTMAMPDLGSAAGADPSTPSRPLTDDEIERCRMCADLSLFETRAPAVFALAEAGGEAGEVAAVRVGDLDLDARTVAFRGAVNSLPRSNPLTPWGATAVRAHLERLGCEDLLHPVVVGRSTGKTSATASVSGVMRDILNRAGLGNDKSVQPKSIRAWSGRAVWERTHDIFEVARWLGCHSLDQAAYLIGVSWRDA